MLLVRSSSLVELVYTAPIVEHRHQARVYPSIISYGSTIRLYKLHHLVRGAISGSLGALDGETAPGKSLTACSSNADCILM